MEMIGLLVPGREKKAFEDTEKEVFSQRGMSLEVYKSV